MQGLLRGLCDTKVFSGDKSLQSFARFISLGIQCRMQELLQPVTSKTYSCRSSPEIIMVPFVIATSLG